MFLIHLKYENNIKVQILSIQTVTVYFIGDSVAVLFITHFMAWPFILIMCTKLVKAEVEIEITAFHSQLSLWCIVLLMCSENPKSPKIFGLRSLRDCTHYFENCFLAAPFSYALNEKVVCYDVLRFLFLA